MTYEAHLNPPDLDPPRMEPGETLQWTWDDFNLAGTPMKGYSNPKELRLCANFTWDGEDWDFEDAVVSFEDSNGELMEVEVEWDHPILIPYMKRLDACVKEHAEDNIGDAS